MNYIELNKLSHLHDGTNIIFCHTDHLLAEFNYIRSLPNNVVLITANSDEGITDHHVSLVPNNVAVWFAVNALSRDSRLVPLPLGLGNTQVSVRPGHGVGYFERGTEIESLLRRPLHQEPTKKLYANFTIGTNPNHRTPIKIICENLSHVDWQEPNLTFRDFFDQILNYQMVVCPMGNGVDTHRLWEVLYTGRIPVTIKGGDFKIYDLYEKLPIIILDSPDDLYNLSLIESKYNLILSTKYDQDLLDCNWWINQIINTSNKIKNQ